MFSRDLKDLKPETAEKARDLIYACGNHNIELLVYCTFRDNAEQALLFCQGRTAEQIQKKAQELEIEFKRPDLAAYLVATGARTGKRVTWAGPGQSMHQYGFAFDCVPMVGGKPVWDRITPINQILWAKIGRLGTEVGLEWAGYWPNFKEFPHFQEPNIKWEDLI